MNLPNDGNSNQSNITSQGPGSVRSGRRGGSNQSDGGRGNVSTTGPGSFVRGQQGNNTSDDDNSGGFRGTRGRRGNNSDVADNLGNSDAKVIGGRGGNDDVNAGNTGNNGLGTIGDNNRGRGRGTRGNDANNANDGPNLPGRGGQIGDGIVDNDNNNSDGFRGGRGRGRGGDDNVDNLPGRGGQVGDGIVDNNNNNNSDGFRGGRGRGRGRGDVNFDRPTQNDIDVARRNIGRGRGNDGDHRNWSGKWKDNDRFVAADRIRGDWKRRWHDHDHDYPFTSNWWRRHNRFYNPWNVYLGWGYSPYYWWGWSTAPYLNSYFGWGWPNTYYWDYGPGEYIYCYDNVVYVNGRWFAPQPVYYQQTAVLAQSAPVFTPEQAVEVEWLPLGVFAVTRDGVVDPELMVQLAVTADGTMGGTAFNQGTGVSYDITGRVDKQTQRAAWTFVDGNGQRVLMETSVSNLTQPEATGLIHYGPDSVQVIELVRLEQPAAEELPAAAAELPPAAAAPIPIVPQFID